MDDLKELTRSEGQVMQILWRLEKAFVRDIINEISGAKPAYNTVSTVLRILEKKKFVYHKSYGRTYEYHPIIGRDQYVNFYLKSMLNVYFDRSFTALIRFYSTYYDVNVKVLTKLLVDRQK